MKYIGLNGVPGWLGNYVIDSVDITNNYDMKVMYYGKPPLINTTKHASFNSGNILNYNNCLEATKDIDAFIHIAGIIHPKKIKDFYEINTKGTDNIVRACIENNVDRLIYISSNSSFGSAPYTMNEYSEQKPYMGYGKSKLLAETLLMEKALTSGIKIICLNPCWYFGAGQPSRQNKLFKMIQKGKPLIFGDGNNLRSTTWIGNLTHAIDCAIQYDKIEEGEFSQFWIADKKPYTTNEIYQLIADELNVKIKPIHIPSIACKVGKIGDSILQKLGIYNQYIHVLGEFDQNIACDTTLAQKVLGYNPVDLKVGIQESIKWCKKNNIL